MKLLKNNIKIIIAFVLGGILISGIAVYATYDYLATQVYYTKNNETTTVSAALNDLYTKLDTATGEGKYWKKGTESIAGGNTVNINLGFVPSYIIFTRARDKCDIVYNSSISTTKQYIRGEEANLNRGDTGIVSIGTTVSFLSTGNTETWYWMAVK